MQKDLKHFFTFLLLKWRVLLPEIYGIKYSRMNQVKILIGCLPQILLGPFLNTLPHIEGKLMDPFGF